jgi:hypothetical protein
MEMDTSLTDCVLVVSVFIFSENSEPPEATVFSRANSGGAGICFRSPLMSMITTLDMVGRSSGFS